MFKDEYGLTAKQKMFADLVISGVSDLQAYKQAGYSHKYAEQNASKLRKQKDIAEYIRVHTSPMIDERILTNTELLAFWSSNVLNESLSMVERRENSRLLANSKGMFKTKVEVDADVDYLDVLAKARSRSVPKHEDIERSLAGLSTVESTPQEKG